MVRKVKDPNDYKYLYNRRYYKKNRKKLREYSRNYLKNNRERILGHKRKYFKNNREHILGRRRENRYGIKPEQFNALVLKQKGRCKICGTKPKLSLCVDHCHKTKKWRGLICADCNIALGLFKDKVINLKEAVKYLERRSRIMSADPLIRLFEAGNSTQTAAIAKNVADQAAFSARVMLEQFAHITESTRANEKTEA